MTTYFKMSILITGIYGQQQPKTLQGQSEGHKNRRFALVFVPLLAALVLRSYETSSDDFIMALGGAYFLYEGYKPLPAKDSLLQFSGNISFIGECKSIRRGGNKQRIKSSNEENEFA